MLSRTPAKVVLPAAAIIVVIVVAALIGLFTVGSSSGPSSGPTQAAGSATDSAPDSSAATSAAAGAVPVVALAWAQQALPKGATVLVEPRSAAALRSHGLRPLVPQTAAGKDIAFVIVTQTLRDDAKRYPAVARALQRSVPVATFTTSTSDVTIRQVTDVSAARLAAADDARLQADQQLLDNRSVRSTAAVQAVLQAGGLDARPAGVVALLTDMGSVQIVRINVTAAEHAAGRPARSLDLRGDDPGALRRQLNALSGMYRIADVHRTADGALRATWPVDVTPINQPS